jgi:hypothetical protein
MYNQSASTLSSSSSIDSQSKFIFSIADDKFNKPELETERLDKLVITKPTVCKMEIQKVENEKNGKPLCTPATPEYSNGIPYIILKIKASDANGNWSLINERLYNNNTKRAWVVCKALGLVISDFKKLDIRTLVGASGYAEIESQPYASTDKNGNSEMKNGLAIKKWLINVSHDEIEAAMQQINVKPASEEEIPF